MPRLLVAISAHGLGHLGQAAPVCNALLTLRPDLELTIWSALPVDALRPRIRVPFAHICTPCDIGFVMHDAMLVDVPGSWQRYEQRERYWTMQLDTACALVRACQPNLIVSDVGEMPLAAGQKLGISTIAMSSLNWADMADFYFADIPGSPAVIDRLRSIYDNTTVALRLSPGMPMRGLVERILPPVGAVSQHARQDINRLLRLDLPFPEQPRILVGLGGIETHLPLLQWPVQSAINLVVANQKQLPPDGDPARGIVNADTLRTRHGWNFCDLLTGCDAVICKPGYGTLVEAVLAQCPVLFVPREDWPEQAVLIEWLSRHGRCLELAASDLQQGRFLEALQGVMRQSEPAPPPHDGAFIAAREILALLA